jgi:cytochrome c oxidase subunit III
MAGTANHDYHILPPDIWPLIGSISAVTFTSGMVLYMHDLPSWQIVLGLGVMGLIATFFSWFSNIVKEAEEGYHKPVVQLHLRYGMILFIASEVMFFVGWFWAWFDFSLFPSALSEVVGGQFPPVAVEEVLDPFGLPLLNTLILLCSGTTVTWAHHSLIHGDRDGLKKGLWATIILGALFTAIQAYEYAVAPFGFGGNTYGSAFYMATAYS